MHKYKLLREVTHVDHSHEELSKILKENGIDFDLLLIEVKSQIGYCYRHMIPKVDIKPYTS